MLKKRFYIIFVLVLLKYFYFIQFYFIYFILGDRQVAITFQHAHLLGVYQDSKDVSHIWSFLLFKGCPCGACALVN